MTSLFEDVRQLTDLTGDDAGTKTTTDPADKGNPLDRGFECNENRGVKIRKVSEGPDVYPVGQQLMITNLSSLSTISGGQGRHLIKKAYPNRSVGKGEFPLLVVVGDPVGRVVDSTTRGDDELSRRPELGDGNGGLGERSFGCVDEFVVE